MKTSLFFSLILLPFAFVSVSAHAQTAPAVPAPPDQPAYLCKMFLVKDFAKPIDPTADSLGGFPHLPDNHVVAIEVLFGSSPDEIIERVAKRSFDFAVTPHFDCEAIPPVATR